MINGIQILDGSAMLKCSEDCMELRLIPQGEEIPPGLSEIDSELLESADIKHGRLDIPRPLEDGSYLLAEGTPPENGKDGKIIFKVKLPGASSSEEAESEAEESENDELYLDPFQSSTLVNVRKNQVIAVRTPPTRGTAGKNIFGEEVPPVPGKWISFKLGDGVEVSADDLSLKSVLDGIIVLDAEQRIHVKEEWTIDGSVDLSTGHITFLGKRLEITGAVLGGMKVDVQGDLVINGSIEDEADVRVGGNLEVKGIIRAHNTRVRVGRNMRCRAVERSEISVRGNLEVEDYILDARCKIGGNVNIVQGKGLLLGGRMFARGSLRIKVIGSSANVPTLIHAGYDPALKKEIKRLGELIEETREKITNVRNGLQRIKKLEKQKPLEDKMKIIKEKLTEAFASLSDHLIEHQKRLAEVQKQILPLKEATVEVPVRAFANTTIIIGDVMLHLKKDVERVRFKFHQGEVVAIEI